ncbi:hypothetical protein TWF481_002022 [Arthrobotrys musiformis]|uniref:Carrier domain-containing protein n=1 Tax=Arthrobotrys musiformis TaxID=47236 RepID=A0AAV9VTP1_9PEZI
MAPEPVAIIGFAFKFPSGNESPDAFWAMMMDGDTGLSEIPNDRVNLQAFLDISGGASENQTLKRHKGYFMSGDIGAFDAPFFSISAEEAVAMDPQQRLLLETTYHALENAGIPLSQVTGTKTSVHVGYLSHDYRLSIGRDAEAAKKYSITGSDGSILANRLSWYYNFKGPSMAIETACSSSLVALDLASQLLQAGETDMAVVGGVSLTYMPDLFVYLDNMGFLSPDSRCHSFDSRGNGYARSEGVGVVILKRLSDAIKPGLNHTIRAVIRSTGTNSDGYTSGLTQPSGKSQIALMKETYEKAGLDMEPTRFCEAHGTGTLLGDPIESAAIGTVFKPARSSEDPLYIGASKANIGHLEAASGIAGVIKSVLVLENGVIPPIADLVTLNPEIDDVYYRLKFPNKPIPWPSSGLRRASVNSFGFGGTNAHVILDDAKCFLAERGLHGNHNTDSTEQLNSPDSRPYLLVLSAADRNGIKRLGESYSSFFSKKPFHSNETYRRLSYTLKNHRTSLPWKSYSVANSKESLISLDKELSVPQRSISPKDLSLAFVFTGQGAQWPRMGIELMQYPAFSESIKESAQYLRELGCYWDLETELRKEGSDSRMNEPEISQPISCSLQIALVDLLDRIKLRPTIVLGHSSGEVAAAYCKGAISHISAIRIAYYRGLGGAAASKDPIKRSMMSVGLSEADAVAILQEISSEFGDLHIACINSPSNVTVAGDDSHLDALKKVLDQKSIFARKLKVSCAYHSPHMIPIAKEYFSRAGRIEPGTKSPKQQSIPMISYLDGELVSDDRLQDLDYWIQNMCSAVRFTDNVKKIDQLASLAATGRKRLDLSHRGGISITNILEIGPHSALKGPLRDIMQKTFQFVRDIKYDSALVRGSPGQESILRAAGNLHSYGFELDVDYLNGIDSETVPQLVDLPCYPFSRNKTYWSESRRSQTERLRSRRPNEILGNPSPDWHPFSATWRNFLSRTNMDWVEDHNISDAVLYPGSGMLAMAIEAMSQLAHEALDVLPAAFNLKHIEFLAAIQIPVAPSELEVQVQLKPQEEGSLSLGWFEFEVYSFDGSQWKKNCKGLIRGEGADTLEVASSGSDGSLTPNSEDKFQFSDEECTTPCTPDSITDPADGKYGLVEDTTFERSIQSNLEKESASGYVPTHKFFDSIKKAGYNYGPAFQRISDLRHPGPGRVQARVFSYISSSGTSRRVHGTRAVDTNHIIHPATLDAFFQLPLANIVKEQPNMPTMIPSKIKHLWLSRSGLNDCSKPLLATALHNFSGYRGSEHSVSAIDSSGSTKITISGYEMIRVSDGSQNLQEITPNDLHHCWKFDWNPISTLEELNAALAARPLGETTRSVEIHLHHPKSTAVELAHTLKDKIQTSQHHECKIVVSALEQASTADLKIILWDVDNPSILENVNKDDLSTIQKTLGTTSNHVLWVQTAELSSPNYPSHHLVDGLARVLRQENSMAGFATLSLPRLDLQERVDGISQVCRVILSDVDNSFLPQTFRQVAGGIIEYCQLGEAVELTRKVQSAKSGPVPMPRKWSESYPVRIKVGSPGVFESIHFIEDLEAQISTTLQVDDVEVQVHAAGVNFKDCLIALGALNESTIGSEISGTVSRIGKDVQGHGLKPGDRVCGFATDGYRTLYRCKGSSLSRIPESSGLTNAEAASIPVNFATAWHALYHVARLVAGETVLIHSGAGGTGQAAIQIAQHLGAKVFATVSTQEKRDLLTSRYGIPSKHIFNSRDSKFADEIKRLVGGVDVVLNSLSGDVLFSSWECMAPFGRFVEIGKKDIQAQGKLPMAQFEKNISFNAVDLGHMHQKRPKYVAQLINEVLERFGTGERGLRPVSTVQIFDVSKIIDAFRLIGTGKSTGKIIVEMTPSSEVPVVSTPKLLSKFSPDASYIIAGGLGGLGRVTARWMAERGAKNLVLLSRSGPKTEEAKDLVRELRAMGVNCVAPACDITNRNMLYKTLQSLDIPPIKGCIQSSMVLRSALFSDMTHDEWTDVTACKVAGSWNLHDLLPNNLDFFILLSSVQAVFGARTQANYNAANTYMDGLAHHRVSKGLKAVSIMLGLMTTDGYLAEADHRDERELLLAQNTYHGVDTEDYHALLDYYCNPELAISTPGDAQVTIGMKLLHEDPELDPLGTIWGRNPMFKALRRLTESDSLNGKTVGGGKRDVASLLAAAQSTEEATEIILKALTTRLSSTIAGMDPEEMDQTKSIQSYGVDSLQTMELRSWFLRFFRADLPTFSILGAPSLTALSSTIAERSTLRSRK